MIIRVIRDIVNRSGTHSWEVGMKDGVSVFGYVCLKRSNVVWESDFVSRYWQVAHISPYV